MPRSFRLFDTVRVAALRSATDDGWWKNQRSPRVGDVGAVVDALRSENGEVRFVVECVAADGSTEWLGEFVEAERQLQS